MLGVILLSAYHKAKFLSLIIKGRILDENGGQQLSYFKQAISTSNDRLSTAHLSTTSETSTDCYSNEEDSLTSLNDHLNDEEFRRSEVVQPFANNLNNLFRPDNQLHSQNNKFNNQHSDVICVRFINDECLEIDQQIESI